ncbi:MAG: type I-B CRISPR-associated endonuclease Cas1b [bacterium]
MSMKETLYIFTSGKLNRKDNTLLLTPSKEDDENSKTNGNNNNKIFLPIERIKDIFIFSEVTINTKLINFLASNEVIVHFFNYYGYYTSTLYPREKYLAGELIIKQVQNYLDNEKRLYLAKCFVLSGIYHILRNLSKNLPQKNNEILNYEEIESQVYKTKNIPELMSIEGRIRNTYYKEYFGIDQRTKNPPLDKINSLISFGNSLLYSTIITELYYTQLNPTISYLHEPYLRRFSLALDISEIFKPIIIDTTIKNLINNDNILDDFNFEQDLNYVFLNEVGKKKFVKKYKDKLKETTNYRKLKREVSFNFLIRLESYRLIKHFMEEELYTPLKTWW